MKNWIVFSRKIYKQIVNSIAFYPALIGLSSMAFAIVVLGLQRKEWVTDILGHLKHFLVQDPDTGRTILATITAGVISLMVFSFSMVMVVLNRASATLSPRVLPGLISRKFHQIVLGFYLGTIIFSLILLVNTTTLNDGSSSMPSLGILLSMISCIGCLCLFVYFIHSISKNIEVDSIMDNIYTDTRNRLKEQLDKSANIKVDEENWYVYNSPESGYLKHLARKKLTEIGEANDVIVELLLPIGAFATKDLPLIRCNKQLDDQMEKEILSQIIFYYEERVSEHYSFGFKLLSEISIKALSPGINDPGTAIKGVDLLSDLFMYLTGIEPYEQHTDSEDVIRLVIPNYSFEDILFRTMIPILHYGCGDVLVMEGLISATNRLYQKTEAHPIHQKSVKKLLKTLRKSSKKHLETKWEQKYLDKY